MVNLNCKAIVEELDCPIHWCYKRRGIDNAFIEYPGLVTNQSDAIDNCSHEVYTANSQISFSRTEGLSEVDFLCEVGWNLTCNASNGAAYKIYNLMIRKFRID